MHDHRQLLPADTCKRRKIIVCAIYGRQTRDLILICATKNLLYL